MLAALQRLREVIHNHPLWVNATTQEVDFASIDTERYLMRLAFPTYVPYFWGKKTIPGYLTPQFFIFSAFSPNPPFDEERDQVFEKHIATMKNLDLTHPVFGLSPAFQQLPFHLAIKGSFYMTFLSTENPSY